MKNSLLYWSVISTFGFLFSSADLTSTGSPKRSIKHYRPSTISLDYSRKNPQNSNHENPDRENEDHPVRLFGFRRIGTVFPATLSKNGSGSGYHLPDKFLTMPHKKQVKQKQKQKKHSEDQTGSKFEDCFCTGYYIILLKQLSMCFFKSRNIFYVDPII
jgi:hypothetical protein